MDNQTNSTYDFEGDSDIYLRTVRICIFIFTLISVVCVLIDLLLIYVTIKYKRLRDKKINIILLNWFLLTALYFASIPITINLQYFVAKYQTYFCIIGDFESTLLLGCIIATIFLTMFWYISVYHPATEVKFNRTFYWYLSALYLTLLLAFLIHIYTCLTFQYFSFSAAVLWLLYIAFSIFMIIINILHLVKKRMSSDDTIRKKLHLPLVLSNVFLITKLPLLIESLLPIWGKEAFIVMFICSVFATIDPVYNLIVLYKYDKDYQVFLRHVLSGRFCYYRNDEMNVEFSNEDEVVTTNHS